MSVSGISSSSLFDLLESASPQSQKQQVQQEVQKLGQDLSAGNLSAAQADFATLQKDAPQTASTSQNNNPIDQALQSQSSGGGHHHHSHAQDSSSSSQQNPLAQLFSELGQALQSGNLS